MNLGALATLEVRGLKRISFPINVLNFPQMNADEGPGFVARLQKRIDDAIDDYYIHNTIIGCMESDSAYFNYRANVNISGSCERRHEDYVPPDFGGLYQVCKPLDGKSNEWCNDLTFVNIGSEF